MAIQIRVSPDGLRAAAERQRTIANMVQEINGRMGNLSSALNAAWDGSASQQALGAMVELRDATQAIAECIESGATKLNDLAQAFEFLDEGKSGAIPIVAKLDLKQFPMLTGTLRDILNFTGVVRIVPDEVRAVAGNLEDVCAEIVDALGRLRQNADALAGEWEGRAYQKYQVETEELAAGMKQVVKSVEEFADRIRFAATRYEEIDNMF